MPCSAEVSDHFAAWMALGGALVAAAVALAGVGLGGWLESQRDERKWQREQATRFHDERLSAYTAYMAAASTFLAAVSVWVNSGGATSLLNDVDVVPTLDAYVAATSRVSMLAGSDVLEHLQKLHECVERVREAHSSVDVVRLILTDSLEARAYFEIAAKRELGILT